MTIEIIDAAFIKAIGERGSHRRMGISVNYAAQLRYKLRRGLTVSTDLKLKLLQRTGWITPDTRYTYKDLVEVARVATGAGRAGKDLGPEYLVEKFLRIKQP